MFKTYEDNFNGFKKVEEYLTNMLKGVDKTCLIKKDGVLIFTVGFNKVIYIRKSNIEKNFQYKLEVIQPSPFIDINKIPTDGYEDVRYNFKTLEKITEIVNQ